MLKILRISAGEPSTLYVPAGNYSVWPLVLDDTECTDLLFNLTGTLLAPSDPADYKWVKNVSYLLFKNCKNFTLHGSGTGVIDGRGQNWWELFKKHNVERPYLSILDDGEYLAVRDITLMDSPMFHLVPRGSKHILVEGVTIHAPSDSPNTDGIDPSDSEDVMILNCNISTGDDNVAVKGGCQGVLVQDCYFAYGHGCSIGSINTTGVQDVMLKNITFVGTENGARIKTWQGGTALVQNISYVSLRMEEVGYPILIDMYYCPGGGCKNQTKGEVSSSSLSCSLSSCIPQSTYLPLFLSLPYHSPPILHHPHLLLPLFPAQGSPLKTFCSVISQAPSPRG